MAVIRGGEGRVQPQVQDFADYLESATGADFFGTYLGHDPSLDLALDAFTPVNSRTLGDKMTDHALSVWGTYGLYYMIYRQQIYNPSISPNWRPMADRGSLTQNHYDHVHFSFLESFTYNPTSTEDDPFMALSPDQQELLLNTTIATNEAVGRLEVAIRDQTSGLQKQVAALTEEVSGLTGVITVLTSVIITGHKPGEGPATS